MKRFWLGLGLMLLLLAIGIAATVGMQRVCDPISRQLQKASFVESWEQAAALSSSAQARWQELRRISAAVTDHEPMEQIDALFGSLEVYLRHRDSVHFADCCAQLVALTEAVAEAQAVNWWNIF